MENIKDIAEKIQEDVRVQEEVRQDFVDNCVRVFKAPGGTVQQKQAFMKKKGATDAEITQALDIASGGELMKAALGEADESTFSPVWEGYSNDDYWRMVDAMYQEGHEDKPSAGFKVHQEGDDIVVSNLDGGEYERIKADDLEKEWSHVLEGKVNEEGEEKERRDSLASMGKGFLLALLAIYALLAIPFRSYSQPLLIMAAIPFGMVGAIAGHLIMGFSLSMLSIFGIVALSGVVINDSLLLIDQVNRNRRENKPLFEAVIDSGMRRFRPILLTSLTTFFGLMPMIFETSVQAQFLIPMAISLGFGIMFATGITLLLIPTLYMILEDIRRLFGFREMAVSES